MATKKCKKCNSEVSNKAMFCEKCGAPLKEDDKEESKQNNKEKYDKSMTTAGFVCSILGYLTCGFTSVVGLILSWIGLSNSKRILGKEDTLAIAGIVSSIPPLLFLIIGVSAGFIDAMTAADVKVEDFSTMTREEVEKWCSDLNANCDFVTEYSDTIPEGEYIKQNVKIGKTVKTYDRIEIVYSKGIKEKPIEKPKIEKIVLNTNEISISAGETYTISYTIEPSDIEIENVKWTSSDDKIATVSDGVVTGIKEGKTTITLKINEKSETIKVNINRAYMKVYVDDMENELEENAAAAKEKYKGQYVEVTGRLGVIDSDLKYIGLYSISDSWDFTGILCRIKDTETKERVKTLSKDQTITVRGKITDAGEVLGYYMNIDEIIT